MIDQLKKAFHKFTHSKFFEIVVVKFDAITVSLVSIVYGWVLITHPRLLNYSETYDVLSQLFTSQFFGFLFLSLGSMKILSIVFNSRVLKVISICFLFGLWLMFASALYLSDAFNTIYIHCFGWGLICLGVVLRELFE